MTETMAITAEQREAFQRDGFLALPAVTTPTELEELHELYDGLFRERVGRDEGNQFDLTGDADGAPARLPQILHPTRYAPALAATTLRRNAEAIARALLGDDARMTFDHAILKPARSGAATPWHQDEAYWDPDWDYEAISVWVPLQEATVENGCLQFVAGSHRGDILPHRHINDDPAVHGLELAVPVDAGSVVACPLPAGGCTIHLSRTLHYAGPNTSDTPRRAYIMAFERPRVRRVTRREAPWYNY